MLNVSNTIVNAFLAVYQHCWQTSCPGSCLPLNSGDVVVAILRAPGLGGLGS